MREHASLGCAGGARGVDDVGGLFGRDVPWRGRGLGGDRGLRIDHAARQGMRGHRGEFSGTPSEDDHAAVGNEEREPLLGIGGIEGHVGRTGLEDGEHADDEVDVAGAAQADAGFGPRAGLAQRRGERIGASVEIGVGQRAGGAADSDRCGRLRGDPLERAAQPIFSRISSGDSHGRSHQV